MISRRTLIGAMGAASVLPAGVLAAERRVFKAPVALEGGRLLAAVGINGQGPFIFMIDTGGVVSLIRDDLAKKLELGIIGHSRLGGIGKPAIYPSYLARDFVIGGTMRQAKVVLVGAGDLEYGRDVLGTLAAGMLTASDSELDFDAGELRLYPDGRGDRPGFTRIPSRISRTSGENASAYIFVKSAIDGQQFDFILDTGAPRPIHLSPEASRRTGYWNDGRPYVPVRAHGVGGQGMLGRIVRADIMDFGGLRIDRPLLMLNGPGRDWSGTGDGIIGLALIRRLNLSIDVGSRSLWVQPNRQPAVAERYGLSGIWVDRKGDATVIAAVGTGSPAAAAGLRADDRIVGEGFDAVIRKLGSPPGEIPLAIERDGARRQVTLQLRPYL